MDKSNTTPVTIIGGYLGGGKTTLINHLLRNANGTRLAILVNDFGELPIDANLIESKDDNIISLSGGCVCCSYGDDLSSALIELQTISPAPDHIIIEASGVAMPGAIGNSLSLQRGLTLQGIVVLADVATIASHAADKYLADTIDRQLSDADLLVLNKLDLVSTAAAQATQAQLTKSYPHARVIAVTDSQVTTTILLENHHTGDHPTSDKHVHHSTLFSTITLELKHKTDAAALAQKLSHNDCGLVRAKGFVTDTDGKTKTIQVVGRRWSINPAPVSASAGLVCIGINGEFTLQSVTQFCGLEP